MAVKRYDGSAWQTVAGLGAQGPAATSSSIATWVKTASGGETSLSGNDDSSQALSYTVGQELVFINGVLQKRGDDYTATTGNSITGLTVLTAGDIVSVWTVNAFSVTNAISNTIMDAKGDLLTASSADVPARLAVGTNGHILTADSTAGTGIKWAANSQGWTSLSTTNHSGNATCTITGISTAYKNLRIIVREAESSSTAGALYLDVGAATTYSQQAFYTNGSAQTTNNTLIQVSGGQGFVNLTGTSLRSSNGDSVFVIDVYDYTNTTVYKVGRWTSYYLQGSNHGEMTSGWFTVNDLAAISQIILQLQGGANLSAKVEIYGEN
jgi:hypothetical protein